MVACADLVGMGGDPGRVFTTLEPILILYVVVLNLKVFY